MPKFKVTASYSTCCTLEIEAKDKEEETLNANTLTKETLESLTNPDLIEKRKEFQNAIDGHIEKEETRSTVKDEIILNFRPMHHTTTIGDVVDKVVELSKEKLDRNKLIEAIKLTYSQEDMFKCFYESRLTNPIVGFKFDSFASYMESLQK